MERGHLSEEDIFCPEVFRAQIGGFPGPFYEVSWDEALLKWTDFEKLETIRPEAIDWQRFWSELDKIKIWEWEQRYDNPHVLDGTSWSVHIEYQGKSLKSSGSNAYPDSKGAAPGKVFKKFCRAVSNLVDGKDFY